MTIPKPPRRGPKPRRRIERSTKRIRTKRVLGWRRRAAKAASTVDHFERWRIFLWYDGLCAYCPEPHAAEEMDHIQPIAKGGRDEAANLAPICRAANQRKGQGTAMKPKRMHPYGRTR